MKTSHARPPLWNVPYRQNLFFTGREDILQHLDQALHAESAVALSHPQGISGLGGIGKTQTALEYAYRYGGNYDAVFWVQADSAATLTSGYATLAQVLQLPERDEQDQCVMVEAVLRWFRVHPNWLLVFDGMDDLSVAEPFLPKAGQGHILFTTRAHALGGIAERIEVRQMEPETGALLLLRRASLLALQETLSRAKPDDQIIACAISQELDGLPLALDQAGAYIKEAPCLPADYLHRYRTRRRDLLGVRGFPNQDYPASVATTWSLSFEKARQADPAAAELLNFCAYLSPEAIPEEILTAGASHLGAILAPVVSHPLRFDQVCKEALRFSLVQREADARTLTIHRLVQAVLRDNLPAETQLRWMQSAVHAVDAAYPNSGDVRHWPVLERLLPHALICATWVKQASLATSKTSHLLNNTGYYLHERGRYAEAEPLLQCALSIREQRLGSDPYTATSLNNLAELYRARGLYKKAEPLHQRALSIREQMLGPAHPDTAQSLHNLAGLYHHQGLYTEAESLLQRALSIREQRLGSNHPDTATSLHYLALLYQDQGLYEKAEPLYLRALSIREQQLGSNHPYTATSLNNLAELYQDQEQYEKAEPLYQRALSICEQQLGSDHPDTATHLNNLAELYRNQEQYEKAEPFYQRALSISEQQLGSDHPATATSLNNLAVLYGNQGQYKKAEQLHQRALLIRKQQLGPNHPHTATSLNNLAELYRNQGQYVKAEQFYQRALSINEQQLGADHLATVMSLNNLAGLYYDIGQFAKAGSLFQRALSICEHQLGFVLPNTVQIICSLLYVYFAQRQYQEARNLLEHVLYKCEQVYGPTHSQTLRIRDLLLQLMELEG
jgi:tetratricopeptide (TPR) repeat protein